MRLPTRLFTSCRSGTINQLLFLLPFGQNEMIVLAVIPPWTGRNFANFDELPISHIRRLRDQGNHEPRVKHPGQPRDSNWPLVVHFGKRIGSDRCETDRNLPIAHNRSDCPFESRASDPGKLIDLARYRPGGTMG